MNNLCEFDDLEGNVNGPEEPLNATGYRMGLKFRKDSNGFVVISLKHKGADDVLKPIGWAWMNKAHVAELLKMLQS